MSIRETIQQNQRWPAIAAGLIIVVGIAVIWGEMRRAPGSGGSAIQQQFYSDDDGQTWFADDVARISPFDHHGKKACVAAVFRCDNGRPFVGYLQRYSEEAKANLEKTIAAQPGLIPLLFASSRREVKKPGDSKWTAANGPNVDTASVSKILDPGCPAGSQVVQVTPQDSDNGATE